jgi:hypothetical protein
LELGEDKPHNKGGKNIMAQTFLPTADGTKMPTDKTRFGGEVSKNTHLVKNTPIWDTFRIISDGTNYYPQIHDFFMQPVDANADGFTPKSEVTTNMKSANQTPYGNPYTVRAIAFQSWTNLYISTDEGATDEFFAFLRSMFQDSMLEIFVSDKSKGKYQIQRIGGLGHMQCSFGNAADCFIANGVAGRRDVFKLASPIPIYANEKFSVQHTISRNSTLLVALLPEQTGADQYYYSRVYLIGTWGTQTV